VEIAGLAEVFSAHFKLLPLLFRLSALVGVVNWLFGLGSALYH
jgi:hypothetical protein